MSSKRDYESPRLVRHGTVAELTNGGQVFNGTDKASTGSASDLDLKREIRRVGGALARLRRL